jgi:large subunit ribosomal protein L22
MATHDIRAQALDTPVSAQKARLIVNMVRGKNVVQALTMLKFMPNYAAKPVSTVLASAVANAEENFGISRDDLFVYRIFADEATTRKWRRFGPRGRFMPWLRRSSHITVILREREGK